MKEHKENDFMQDPVFKRMLQAYSKVFDELNMAVMEGIHPERSEPRHYKAIELKKAIDQYLKGYLHRNYKERLENASGNMVLPEGIDEVLEPVVSVRIRKEQFIKAGSYEAASQLRSHEKILLNEPGRYAFLDNLHNCMLTSLHKANDTVLYFYTGICCIDALYKIIFSSYELMFKELEKICLDKLMMECGRLSDSDLPGEQEKIEKRAEARRILWEKELRVR